MKKWGMAMDDSELFGNIAIRKQYVTEEDVHRALQIQREISQRGEEHKLIGLIMLESGMLSSVQLLDVLKYIEENQASRYY